MRTKSHFINYIRWIARTRNYCPNFTGTALDYILWQLEMHNRCAYDKVTFFDFTFTDDQIEELRRRYYNVPLNITDPSMSDLLEHKEEIRQNKATSSPPERIKDIFD